MQTKRRAGGEETATAESVALRKIRLAYPDRTNVCEVIDQAMLHNKAQKLASFLYPTTFDYDGKFRFTVKLNTEAARLASSKAPNGTGRNCLFPDAEVFTPTGWITLAHLQHLPANTQVMQWNTDGKLTFCVPQHHTYSFDDQMYVADSWFHKNGYTPEHRIPITGTTKALSKGITRKIDRQITVDTAIKASKRSQALIPVSGYYEEGRTHYAFIRLLVAVQADASVEEHEIRFTFTKRRKIERLLCLMDSLQLRFVEQKAPKGYRRFALKRTHPEIERIALMLGKPKLFSWDLLNFDIDTLASFIDETQYWDGSVRGRSWWYFSVEKRNVEIVSTIAHLCGYSSTTWTNFDNNRGYGSGHNLPLHYAKIKPRAYVTTESKHWHKEYYQGTVHCLTTPTGFFLVRYKGVICVTGNSQNTARDDPTGKLPSIRRAIIPDPGHILVEADASQIEGRIVFVRTKDESLIKLARARTDFDQHSYVASLVFKKPIDQVGKGTEERQTAKSVNHAAMRAMQGKTMADRLLKDGVLHLDGTPYTAEECDDLLEAYYQAFSGVRFWQQRIRREVRLTRRLINSWGRIWDVRYEELNDDLYRRAYNFLPQSECAELTNVGTFVPLAQWIKKEKLHSRIRLQEHDALVCSCPVDEAYDVALFMKEHIEVEREYDGVALSVPVEFGVGPNYGEKKELRELPERSVFEQMIKAFVRRIIT